MDPVSRYEAVSALSMTTMLSSRADLILIAVDTFCYGISSGKALCDSSGCSGCVFPRNVLWVDGVVIEVESLVKDGGEKRNTRILGSCIPSSVEKLGSDCFSGCQSLSTVTFESGSNLSSIEDFAFNCCSSLSSICIPSSVETLGGYCFSGCQSLSTVTFDSGSKLSCIEDFAFHCCSSLSSICIPSSVENLGSYCFSGCQSLSSVTFDSGSKLSCIGQSPFFGWPALFVICCPAALQTTLSEYRSLLSEPTAEDDGDWDEQDTVDRGNNE
jgi:hypothetical protein